MESLYQEYVPKLKPAFVERYRELLGERYEEFLRYSFTYLRKSFRINTLKAAVNEVLLRMNCNWSLERIPWCSDGFWSEHKEGRLDIGNTVEHILGYIYVQEAASMIPAVVLEPKPDECVLDMCAAPGSKTTQIASLMKNTGVIVANDISGARHPALGINLQRCGVMNAAVSQCDGRRIGGSYDRILVDAPCSGTGAIRKSMKIVDMWNPKMVERLARLQGQLLDSAWRALKEKGILVYSTCTLEPEENEGVVSSFLDRQNNAHLDEIELEINRSQPITEFKGTSYNSNVRK